MKPAIFDYHRPTEKAEVLKLLAELEDSRVLAGGQSLMPMMNLRIAAPSHLIDLNRVQELAGIEQVGNRLVIGTMTRQRVAERSPLVAQHCPLLREALHHVGFQQTRNRGTIGGSIAHLDPTAEIVTAAFALGAEVIIESTNGERRVPIHEFPQGYLTTQVGIGEMLTRIEFPIWPNGHGAAFDEVTRRGESFAIVAVAALAEVDTAGIVRRAALAIGGLGPAPVTLTEISELIGKKPAEEVIDRISAAAAAVPSDGDINSPADYRQYLAGVLTRRSLHKAILRAQGKSDADKL